MSFLELENKYHNYLLNQYDELYSLYNNIKSDDSLSLETNYITRAILWRMKAFSIINNKIKDFLNKTV